jgi:hypothetical protein
MLLVIITRLVFFVPVSGPFVASVDVTDEYWRKSVARSGGPDRSAQGTSI